MNDEKVMSPGERAAYANGWQARDEEVAQLRLELAIWKRNGGDVLLKAEIERLKEGINGILKATAKADGTSVDDK